MGRLFSTLSGCCPSSHSSLFWLWCFLCLEPLQIPLLSPSSSPLQQTTLVLGSHSVLYMVTARQKSLFQKSVSFSAAHQHTTHLGGKPAYFYYLQAFSLTWWSKHKTSHLHHQKRFRWSNPWTTHPSSIVFFAGTSLPPCCVTTL